MPNSATALFLRFSDGEDHSKFMVLAPGTHSHFESGKFSQFWPEPGTVNAGIKMM